MTDREKAIVMAYTGKCMLTGDKFQIFHKYVEDIMGRPIWTHEMGIKSIENEIKEKSKADFLALCADESSSDNSSKWISVKDRMPKDGSEVLFCDMDGDIFVGYHRKGEPRTHFADLACGTIKNVVAWKALPTPYVESEE